MNVNGHIDRVDEEDNTYITIQGWISIHDTQDFIVLVNGYAYKADRRIFRRDVSEYLNSTGNFGWTVSLDREIAGPKGELYIELVSISSIDKKVIDKLEYHVAPPKRVHQSLSQSIVTLNTGTAAVVCWDLAHNPAGRAYVLVQLLKKIYKKVILVGPLHPRFGDSVWAPINKDQSFEVKAKPGSTIEDYEGLITELSEVRIDFIYICKPRFPSIYIGLRLCEINNSSLALDIDDYEMSFFRDRFDAKIPENILSQIKSNNVSTIDIEATALAHAAIPEFRSKSVSNRVLKEMFGGAVITHLREEVAFEEVENLNTETRQALGINQSDFVVGFIGTIRPHKGVLEIASAVSEIKSSVFLCGGVFDPPSLKDEISKRANGRIRFAENVDFKNLSNFISAMDVLCLPQKADHESAHFQLPSKISDALSHGKPVFVNELGPYSDFIDGESIIKIDEAAGLAKTLNGYKNEFSNKNRQEVFSRSHSKFMRWFSLQEGLRVFKGEIISESEKPTSAVSDATFLKILGRQRVKALAPITRLHTAKASIIVLFWKQNDAGIFGRRVDMLAEHFLSEKIFDRAIIVEPPVSISHLKHLEETAKHNSFAVDGLKIQNLYHKALTQKSFAPGVEYASIFYDKTPGWFLGNKVYRQEEVYQGYAELLTEKGVGQNSTAMLFPHCPYAVEVLRKQKFAKIICDIVDDQRLFASKKEEVEEITKNYNECASKSDIIITNNSKNARSFSRLLGKPVEHVPNATNIATNTCPVAISGVGEKDFVIGYVGNMRDRFDHGLVEKIAGSAIARRRNWVVVLVGPTGGNKDVEALALKENIFLTGPLSWNVAASVAERFDIAIVPHVVSELSSSMDPLKLYFFQGLGLQVVSTRIENSTSGRNILFANDSQDFITLIMRYQDGTIQKPMRITPSYSDTWSERVRAIDELIKKMSLSARNN